LQSRVPLRSRIADGLFVMALMLYVLAGITLTPEHGDEFMYMTMAHDVFYLRDGQLDHIRYAPPVLPDTEQHLRLLNGPLNKDLIGALWMATGRPASALPGIFAWAMPLEWNTAQGNVPTADALTLARWPSALLTALSIVLLFELCVQIGGRAMAYPAALLWTLHPVILLSGRRAMTEGGLLFAMILLLGLAVWIVKLKGDATGGTAQKVRWWAWLALGLCAGLAIAAKHTGVIVVSAAVIGVLWAVWSRERQRALIGVIGAGVIALLTFLAFNPAYWNNPIGAGGAMLDARSALLAMQTRNDPATYTRLDQRSMATITQPFLSAPQYYEAPTWNGTIDDAIARYEASPVSGWRWPWPIGAIFTGAALIGALIIGWRALREGDPIARVLLIWLLASVAGSVVVPIAWQRYYVPMLPALIVAAAYPLYALRVRLRTHELDRNA